MEDGGFHPDRSSATIRQGSSEHKENISWIVKCLPRGAPKRVASGSADRTLRIWDAASGQSVGKPLLGHASLVRGVSFSPDGKRIASASFDAALRLWYARSTNLVAGLQQVERLCPLLDAESEAIGLSDPKFPEAAGNPTLTQRRACGLELGAAHTASGGTNF
jgi:WD40 repeat protein